MADPESRPKIPTLAGISRTANFEELARAYANMASQFASTLPRLDAAMTEMQAAVVVYTATAQRAENTAKKAEGSASLAHDAADNAATAAAEVKAACTALSVEIVNLRQAIEELRRDFRREIRQSVPEFVEDEITKNRSNIKDLIRKTNEEMRDKEELETVRTWKRFAREAALTGAKHALPWTIAGATVLWEVLKSLWHH